jgi:hypothetical protein
MPQGDFAQVMREPEHLNANSYHWLNIASGDIISPAILVFHMGTKQDSGCQRKSSCKEMRCWVGEFGPVSSKVKRMGRDKPGPNVSAPVTNGINPSFLLFRFT